jgi:hypothetical protein
MPSGKPHPKQDRSMSLERDRTARPHELSRIEVRGNACPREMVVASAYAEVQNPAYRRTPQLPSNYRG